MSKMQEEPDKVIVRSRKSGKDYKQTLEIMESQLNEPDKPIRDFTERPVKGEDKKVSIGEFIMQFRMLTSNKPTLNKNQKALKLVESFIATSIKQMDEMKSLLKEISERETKPEEKEDTKEDTSNTAE